MNVTKTIVRLIAAGVLSAASLPALAVNWLQLQGTEPPAAAQRAKLWGFVQPLYQAVPGDDKLDAGPFAGSPAVFNQIRPDLDSNNQFVLRRMRVGVRGTPFPLDSNINYFFLMECGNNGVTVPGGGTGSCKLTDGSITLNHLDGLGGLPLPRVRFGQFKVPGVDEGWKAIHVFDYVNFTNVTDQLMLERFFDNDGSNPTDANRPNGPVGAFRDIGISLFNWHQIGKFEHQYAFMVGNGNGIARGDNNAQKDIYLYYGTEYLFGRGQGFKREGVKVFGWYQRGRRTIDAGWDPSLNGGAGGYTQENTSFLRKRYGVGTTVRWNQIRGGFEYIWADGMIFNGTDGGAVPGTTNAGGSVASFNVLPDNKANGWYVDVGYMVIPNLELDFRYDRLDRGTQGAATIEREFETFTFGFQYWFNRKTRAWFNYEVRDAEAPGFAKSAVPNQILDKMGDRISLQLITIF